jgi:hypothetical protein
MPNPYLDPFHPQAPYASEILDFWTTMIEHDKAYVSRLKRHYKELRAAVGQSTEQPDWAVSNAHETAASPPRGPLTRQDRKTRKRLLERGSQATLVNIFAIT